MIKRYSKNIKIFFNYILGPLIFIVISYILFIKIKAQPDLAIRWSEIKESFANPLLWLAILLMPVNWGLEAAKFQFLTRKFESLNFFTAFKAVLAGCSITMLTPNRIGEYGGRILFIKEENRVTAIAVTMIGSLSQLFVTLVFGTLGLCLLLFFLPQGKMLTGSLPYYAGEWLLVASGLLTCIMLVFYFRIGGLVHWLLQKKVFEKYSQKFHYIHEYSRKDLLRILLLSVFRYISFILQYILILKAMGVNVPIVLAFWLLTVFYLVMTMAPTIGFTELPLRAAASVEILHLYSTNVLGIQAASLAIWFVNLVVPAIAGSLLILGLKIIKDK